MKVGREVSRGLRHTYALQEVPEWLVTETLSG